MSKDLIAFLKARLDEDEQEALAASPGPWKANAEQDEVLAVDDIEVAVGFALSGNQLRATVRHIVRHDPERVLRDVEAKRRIVARHAGPHVCGEPAEEYEQWEIVMIDGEPGQEQVMYVRPCGDLRDLAARYADHEGYREEWRP